MGLIGLLRKFRSKRIGLLTPTIENEAWSVLERVVRKEVETSRVPREQLFPTLSTVLSTCEDRLRGILQTLQREPIIADDVKPWYARVEQMYEEFIQQAQVVDLKFETEYKTDAAAEGYRGLAHRIYEKQAKMTNRQVTQLRYDRPNEADKTLLAEAAYLYAFYKEREGQVTFYLASGDSHFSPMKGTAGGLTSRAITDRISKDFHVICDYPEEISNSLRQEVK